MKLQLYIKGVAHGKARHQAAARIIGGKAVARCHDNPKNKLWTRPYIIALRKTGWNRVANPVNGFSLDVTVWVKVPKSFSARKREDALEGKIYPLKKCDLDNVLKLLCDAYNGRIWADDSLITDESIKRRYAEEDGVELSIEWEEKENGVQ